MEPPKNKNTNCQKTFLRPVKDILLAKSFMVTSLLAISVFATACSEEEQETIYTKNVHSIIKETAPNEFKISEEQIMEGDKSRAYINFLDGTMEEISLDSLQYRLEHSQHPYHYNGNGNLNEILVASAFGSMLSPNYQYRLYPSNPYQQTNHVNRYLVRYFIDEAVHAISNNIRTTVSNSRISVPSSARHGFFHSFHSSSHG